MGSEPQDWAVSQQPNWMLSQLPPQTSERKWRLFAVACCRSIWSMLVDARVRDVVDKAELYADNLISLQVLDQAREQAHSAALEVARSIFAITDHQEEPIDGDEPFWASWAYYDLSWAFQAASSSAAQDRKSLERTSWMVRNACSARSAQYATDPNSSRATAWQDTGARQCELIREIFGNPFRPATIHPVWLTSSVREVARRIDLTCRFFELPILADALEEAGCDNPEILDHCRIRPPSGRKHVRGCWVVDLVLGKD